MTTIPLTEQQLANLRQLRAITADLADRWDKEANWTQRASDVGPLGAEAVAAQQERAWTYRQAAKDLRHVLETGEVPADLHTAADRAAAPTAHVGPDNQSEIAMRGWTA